jgi:G:T/U-mismatch repair DNA glycosylase
MLSEIVQPHLTVIFVGTVVTELSDTLGFYHLHPRDRFWELLAMGAITPGRVITAEESKALTEGHRSGNLTDPVRSFFIQKKMGQLLRLGIGMTDLNRRVLVASEKDPDVTPTDEDIRSFLNRVDELRPKILAFVTAADVFVDSFKGAYPGVTGTLGHQTCTIGGVEVWLLGSTSARPRGEALALQEDAFFLLGERIEELTRGS